MKTKVSVVWFKRDFRLQDHPPLLSALQAPYPILLVTCIEPSLMNLVQYDERHLRCIKDSVLDINEQLQDQKLLMLSGEAEDCFASIGEHYDIESVYSHQETGIKHTFDRDLRMQSWFKERNIRWLEFEANGVKRGLNNRRNWIKDWFTHASMPIQQTDINVLSNRSLKPLGLNNIYTREFEDHPFFQRGGETRAHRVLHSFLTDRITQYAKSISKPQASRKGCSRISPHLAWGNLSIRQVYQYMKHLDSPGSKRNLRAFADRLRWQAHFIQKFESEWEYEFEPINRAFSPLDSTKFMNPALFDAWKEGKTGVPLVDACMRCLQATGYLNFRMRAMVTSFYSQYLWLPWKPGADYLASLFTDFEPGIHYAQFQMQTGYTGVNTIRIYNPIKQSQDHDPDGTFIKQWVPELHNVPKEYIHEPWNIPPLEFELSAFSMGAYPKAPIVPLKVNRKRASDALYALRKSDSSRSEAVRILKKHVNPGPRNS